MLKSDNKATTREEFDVQTVMETAQGHIMLVSLSAVVT